MALNEQNDSASFAEVWSSIKNYIPVKERPLAAEHFLSAITDTGLCDVEDSASEMVGICPALDGALREFIDEFEDDDEETADEW